MVPQYQRLDLNYVKNIYASMKFSIGETNGEIAVNDTKLVLYLGRTDKWSFDLEMGLKWFTFSNRKNWFFS